MRPRVFPAEDSQPTGVPPARATGFNEAAGIPRGRARASVPTPSRCCFNEAAGIPRGRRGGLLIAYNLTDLASMRPRVFPAEDAGGVIKQLGLDSLQ